MANLACLLDQNDSHLVCPPEGSKRPRAKVRQLDLNVHQSCIPGWQPEKGSSLVSQACFFILSGHHEVGSYSLLGPSTVMAVIVFLTAVTKMYDGSHRRRYGFALAHSSSIQLSVRKHDIVCSMTEASTAAGLIDATVRKQTGKNTHPLPAFSFLG